MSKRILVVDDSASVRQLQHMVLTIAGYEVIEAVDGLDGLTKLKTTDIRLILTDINMPNLDGLGFIKAVRKVEEHRFTPIVVISTESKDELKQTARTAGATGWIIKPFAAPQLLAVIKKLAG